MPVQAWSGTLDAGCDVPVGDAEADRPRVLFCFDGMMRVETDAGRWFIPDRFGIWIPPGTAPVVELTSRVEFQSFLLHPRLAAHLDMPPRPTVLRATPLMRGIGRRLTPSAPLTPPEQRRLGRVALDEIARLDRPDLHLPGSRDPRLAQVMARLMDRPAEAGNLGWLAAKVGSSERTLSRLFPQETGLSWRDWRDRMRFVLAVEGLQAGRSSKELATWLGYSGTSAFVAAFRRQSGMTPSDWRSRR